MVLESNGEFKYFIEGSPLNNFKIECIAPYSRGFVCCGENGTFYTFEKDPDDLDRPYKLGNKIESKEPGASAALPLTQRIMSSVITSTEDSIMFITDQN